MLIFGFVLTLMQYNYKEEKPEYNSQTNQSAKNVDKLAEIASYPCIK